MANRSTSPDRPELRRWPPLFTVAAALAVGYLGCAFWLAIATKHWPLVIVVTITTVGIALRCGSWMRQLRDHHAALERAREQGGLAHVVRAQRAGNHDGWLTLHHDTGDIGFFSFTGAAQDIYVPRHTVATVGREPDGSTRVTYLGQDIASFVVASKHNNLELWQMPAAEAHAHARTEIPTAIARLRAES